MLLYDISCALCGAPIEEDDDELWPPWMCQFRAVYCRGRLSTEAYLSGIGRRERHRDVVPPGPIPDGQPVPDGGFFRIWLMGPNLLDYRNQIIQKTHAWGFPFHDSCWEVLALTRPDGEVDARGLFKILWSFPIRKGIINFGHDYGGDACYETHPGTVPVGQELRLVQGRTPGHQTCDPLELSELRRFFEEECSNRDSSYGTGAHAGGEVTWVGVDPFSKLPTEVLQYVLEYLPTADVLHLKQSSAVCTNVPLFQTFWMSRFLPGRECEAVFEARRHAASASLRGRWQSLYHLVNSIRKSDPFTNRGRIWGLACSLRTIMDQVASTSLRGSSADLLDRRDFHWADATTALKESKSFFPSASGSFNPRVLAVPAGALRLFISLVEIYGSRYISAIRLAVADGSSSVIGYQHAASEALVSVVEAGIAGFHLAQDDRGFRGLAVLSSSGDLSKWAGDHSGVSVRKVFFDPTTNTCEDTVQYLLCSFDAFKMVSLSIACNEGDSDTFNGAVPIGDISPWFPSPPSPDLSVLGIDGRRLWRYDIQTPIRLAIFGNTPEDLKTVSGIAVRIGDDGELFDLEVCYPRGIAPVRLGLDGVATGEVSVFTIDSEDGEHIHGMEAFYERGGALLGFKVYTDKPRVGEFLTERLAVMAKDLVHIESLFPEDGTIVGFCSRVSPMWGLTDLGLVSRADTGEVVS